mgnify:CR=1 FL=1
MNTTNKKYTIDDVAKELGISKTTVSRALSGKGRISRETTQRVKEFIDTHNYSPNVMARGLAQNKTYNIATSIVIALVVSIISTPFLL